MGLKDWQGLPGPPELGLHLLNESVMRPNSNEVGVGLHMGLGQNGFGDVAVVIEYRSEERRVGKECPV